MFFLVRRFQYKSRHCFNMRRLRKHIDRLNIVHAIVLRQRLQILRKRGWIAGNIDEAFRFDFLIVSRNVLSQPVLGGSTMTTSGRKPSFVHFGSQCSAVPVTYVAFAMPCFLAFFLASSIDSLMTSMPRTSFAPSATHMPIVPTPQYASTTFSFPVSCAAFSLHHTA